MDIHQKAAVWSSAQLLDAGQSSQTVLRALDTAALQRVRRGRYAALPYPDDPVGEHRRRTIDLAQEVGRAAVVSHGSAAVLWGVEIPPELDLSSVHFTWPGAAGRGTSANIHPHRARLDPEDVLESRTAVGVGGSLEDPGILVTTPARTVYDLARSADQRVAVSVADAMLRGQVCSREDFALVLERAWGRPGSSIAREVMAFADPRSAGDLQSRTRVLLARLGLPRPDLSVSVAHPAYGDIGPLDFELPSLRTVLCCDARAVDGRCPERVLMTDAVRETGRQILWVGESDLRSGVDLLHLLHPSMRAAGPEGRRRHTPVLSARTRC
jgi:hypothetical protein